jgi:hypothetical protein
MRLANGCRVMNRAFFTQPRAGIFRRRGRGMSFRGLGAGACLLLLIGCSEEPSPPVEWFLEDASRIASTLRYCNSIKNKPHYTWCSNANSAAVTLQLRSEEKERQARLEQLRQAPYGVRLIDWYDHNPEALSAVVELCNNAFERQIQESDFGMICTIASQARAGAVLRRLR